MLHVPRIAEPPVIETVTPNKKRVPLPRPAATPAASRPFEQNEQHTPFSAIVNTPVPPSPVPVAPAALPVPLVPFHRGFQLEGWRIAVNSPEDRWTGKHLVSSIFALLWLKAPEHVLNYSSDRHYIQKVRHMMQMRNAASMAPNSRATQAALPGFSEEAEFSLAHALHLPHTIIYTQDRSERPVGERMHLSCFPEHIWQRPALASEASDASDPVPQQEQPFEDCRINPSVWYFSRHATQGQHEILRKNKPASKFEHLQELRKVFLKPRKHQQQIQQNGETKKADRPTSAKPLVPSSSSASASASKVRPSTAAASRAASTGTGLPGKFVSLNNATKEQPVAFNPSALGKWSDTTPKELTSDPRIGGLGHSQALLMNPLDIVATFTSLDHRRATHQSWLRRGDLEQFLRNAETDGIAEATSTSTPGKSARLATAAAASQRPTTASTPLSEKQRKDRLRQNLYADLYNEMDLVPASLDLADGSSPVVGVGTKPRSVPLSTDPLQLHASSPPTVDQFRGRRIVAMLQEFIPPPGDHAEVLRVEWTEEVLAEYARKAQESQTKRRQVKALQKKIQVRNERRAKNNILQPRTARIDEEEDDGTTEESDEQQLERVMSESNLAKMQLKQMDEKRSVCYISRRINALPLRVHEASAATKQSSPTDPSLYERLCCFGYSTSQPTPPVMDSTVMNGVLYTRLSYVCDILAAHIRSISSGNLIPSAMSLFFQIDAEAQLHLLWCDKLVYQHEKALMLGPERPVPPEPSAVDENAESTAAATVQHDADEDEEEAAYAASNTSPIDWSVFDFEAFPPPSPNSALMSEALQGRYHKLVGTQVAALNTQSLKDDDAEEDSSSDEEEKEDTGQQKRPPSSRGLPGRPGTASAARPGTAATTRPGTAAANSRPGTASAAAIKAIVVTGVATDATTDPSTNPSASPPSVQTVEFTVHLEPMPASPITSPKHAPIEAPRVNPFARDDEVSDDEPSSPVAPEETPEQASAPELKVDVAADDSSDEDEPLSPSAAGTAAAASSNPEDAPDQLAALLANKKVESKSEWADEILFEFARKRQAERNHFRRQEEAFSEERTKKAAAVFSTLSPTHSGTMASTTAQKGVVSAPPKKGKQGINLLEGGVAASLGLTTANRREMSSPAAFLLAKQQKLYGSSVPLPGARLVRGQLGGGSGSTTGAGIELAPSAAKSAWESRSTVAARKARALQDAAAGALHSSSSSSSSSKLHGMSYRMRQVELLAPPSEHDRARKELDAKEAARQDVAQKEKHARDQKDEFQARVREQFESASNNAAKGGALKNSASMSALGVAITSSNARTLGYSSSSSSFAPLVKPTLSYGEEADGGTKDDPDGTFLTSTPLSPRSLTSLARNPNPLHHSPQSAFATTPDDASAAPPTNYFTCPKCRLNLQISAVHSTMILDILGEYGRMVQMLHTHSEQFEREIEWKFGKGGNQRDSSKIARVLRGMNQPTGSSTSNQLSEYLDLKYMKESSIPPTLAFVFPHMTYEQYTHYREDPEFLRSTIDLCEDCHLLVRVPMRDGSTDELHSVEPLDLKLGAKQFFNPNTEAKEQGESHASIMSRQSHRLLDQEVEERSFQEELRQQEYARRSRPPGEVDPFAPAASYVPLDVRRLNQSTVELLAQIPYNDLEIAEFERQRAEEELKQQGLAKSEAVRKVLEKYRRSTSHHAEVHGHITKDTPMTLQRKKLQHQLLSSAGVDLGASTASNVSVPVRPGSAFARSPNPFMQPRGAVQKVQASANSLRGAENRRQQAQSERHLDASKPPDKPSELMSRYDPDLVSQMGGVVVSPAADAALVQSTRRKQATESLINTIVETSASVRAKQAADAANEAKFGPMRLQTKFSHRYAASQSSFAPIYSQLTNPKRISAPVDHVALEFDQHLHSKSEFRVRTHTTPVKDRQRPQTSSPLVKVHSTPAGSSITTSHVRLQDLPLPYSVKTSSPYTPQLITVAALRGQIQPLGKLDAPTM